MMHVGFLKDPRGDRVPFGLRKPLAGRESMARGTPRGLQQHLRVVGTELDDQRPVVVARRELPLAPGALCHVPPTSLLLKCMLSPLKLAFDLLCMAGKTFLTCKRGPPEVGPLA